MKTSYTRIFAGLGVVLLGSLSLLSALNISGFDDVLGTWWPLFVIGVGVLVLLNDTKSWVWSLIIIGFGVLYQLKNLDIVNINPWQLFWPVVIIAVGLRIILRRSGSGMKTDSRSSDDLSAILGGVEQANISDDYKGGKVTAVMGGVVLDLRKAAIKEEATLDVFALMGGLELWVPEHVVVKAKTVAILGGIENKSRAKEDKGAPVLYITGQVIMAGIEIKN